MQFLRENTSVEEGAETPCSEVYDRYRRWCTDNGFHALSSRSFGKEISRMTSTAKSIKRKQCRVNGKIVWVYAGLASEQHETETQDNRMF
jgi:phage/plasmid-associated DNA primase